ncbi:ferredoxin [Mycobacterium sp. 050128]|uniref:ferredoxin n=1 Tax=Mycobacterium sp. 050128 TaxID=3096112 RepID=UPI002EDA33F3
MKIVVNFDLCESNALCCFAAPELFEVREDEYLYVLNENPSENLRDKLQDAVNACPKRAISIDS